MIRRINCELAALGFANGPPSFPNPEKKRVPPIAHKRPKTTAMCIQSFRFAGIDLARRPEIRIGAPIKDGIHNVNDSLPMENTAPQMTKKRP